MKKRNWFWNALIVLTLVTCILAFVAHYKNWTKVEGDEFQILSGIYYQKILFSDIDKVSMVDKLPALERASGFSVTTTEKGVFRDSISNHKVYVFVDDLEQQKIKLEYKDSLELFLNFKDSLRTQEQFKFFKANVMKEE
ncbi:hypothetical protein GGR42_002178 [Saonia flava]|uniref:Uncharacterized protein n=1 Tax=Saonia flava TaxID=523696 RepID=A0A846QRT5_9FLAO|nr:hypothetical protein [Saonia flava]NJB71716.1 hypothetical protein [Saonia flava]